MNQDLKRLNEKLFDPVFDAGVSALWGVSSVVKGGVKDLFINALGNADGNLAFELVCNPAGCVLLAFIKHSLIKSYLNPKSLMADTFEKVFSIARSALIYFIGSDFFSAALLGGSNTWSRTIFKEWSSGAKIGILAKLGEIVGEKFGWVGNPVKIMGLQLTYFPVGYLLSFLLYVGVVAVKNIYSFAKDFILYKSVEGYEIKGIKEKIIKTLDKIVQRISEKFNLGKNRISRKVFRFLQGIAKRSYMYSPKKRLEALERIIYTTPQVIFRYKCAPQLLALRDLEDKKSRKYSWLLFKLSRERIVKDEISLYEFLQSLKEAYRRNQKMVIRLAEKYITNELGKGVGKCFKREGLEERLKDFYERGDLPAIYVVC